MPFRRTPFTGFPFDDSEPQEFQRTRNNSSFRTHLDDIAARHPEFAEHLRPWTSDFPSFRTNTTPRKRHPSGSCGEDDTRSQKSGFSSSSNESNPHSDYKYPTERTVPVHTPKEPKCNNPIPQYGLRNTVDLGQKQSSFDEEDRGQRSMSAPPDHRANQPQRFVSRVNIEPKLGMGGNTSTLPKGAPKETQKVRHIPIFVEGRDEPILPKDDHVDQPDNSKQQNYFDHHTFPGFGRREQQHFEAPFTQQQYQQPEQVPSQQQPQTSQQPEVSQPAKPPPQPQAINDPIFKIQQIQKDVNQLISAVDKFTGSSKKDKQYLYLDEMLTRNLLKLDNIETEGKDTIRQARKEAIKCIEKCISLLESKVTKPQESVMPTEVQSSESREPTPNIASTEMQQEIQNEEKKQKLEVGGAVRTGKEVPSENSDNSGKVETESVQENNNGNTAAEQASATSMEIDAGPNTDTDASQNTDPKSL